MPIAKRCAKRLVEARAKFKNAHMSMVGIFCAHRFRSQRLSALIG